MNDQRNGYLCATMSEPGALSTPRLWSIPRKGINMTERTCIIDGCERLHRARGFCASHYKCWKLYGDPHGRAAPRTTPPCTVIGCNQPNRARGLCNLHYLRLRVSGDPLLTRPTIAERLQERIVVSTINAYNGTPCLEWVGARSPKGYGKIGDRRRGTGWSLTHRIAYEIANGASAPDDLLVCHHCDNPPCCNPAHLFLGTHAINVADMWSKNRQRYPRSP